MGRQGGGEAARCSGKSRRIGREPHLFQVLQRSVIDAVLLEINAHGIDHLGDDGVVDGTDCRVRHLDGLLRLEQRRWFGRVTIPRSDCFVAWDAAPVGSRRLAELPLISRSALRSFRKLKPDPICAGGSVVIGRPLVGREALGSGGMRTRLATPPVARRIVLLGFF